MKLTKEYPIYVDPTPEELIELAKTRWDTIRIIVLDQPNRQGWRVALASGYGNTHNSIALALKSANNGRGMHGDPFILWRSHDKFFLNLEYCGGKEHTPLDSGLRYFTDEVAEILSELVTLTDQAS